MIDGSNQNNLKKICNFYAGVGHFWMTVAAYLIKKIQRGSKVIFFTDEELRGNFPGLIAKTGGSFSYETWKRNVILYPLKMIQKVISYDYLINNIGKVVELVSSSCSNEGLVICVQRANNKTGEFIKQLEGSLCNISVPIDIINCYELVKDRNMLLEIFNDNQYLLNTVGLIRIDEALPGKVLKQLAL